MNTTRHTKLMLGLLLVIAILIAFQVLQPSANSAASMPAYTGRGDYQRYELQFFPSKAGESESNRSAAGMGDLHRFEAMQEIEYTGK